MCVLLLLLSHNFRISTTIKLKRVRRSIKIFPRNPNELLTYDLRLRVITFA